MPAVAPQGYGYPQGYGAPTGYGQAPAAPAPSSDLQFSSDEPSTEEPREDRVKLKAKKTQRKKPQKGDAPPDEGEELPEQQSFSGGSLKVILFAVVGIVLLCGVMFSIFYFRGKSKTTRPDNGKELKFDDKKIQYQFPESVSGWERDKLSDSNSRIGANMLHYRKLGADGAIGWAAFHAMKVDAVPTPADVETTIVNMLRKTFDELPDHLNMNEDRMLGTAASRYEFRAVFKENSEDAGKTCTGEVFAVVARGNLYLAYTWGTDQTVNDMVKDFAAIRGGLKFMSGSSGTETRPRETNYRASRLAPKEAYRYFVLTDYEARWSQDNDKNPNTQDPNAILWLEGWDNISHKTANKQSPAKLIVCALDAGADVQAHILKELTDGETKSDLQLIEGDPTGEAAKVTNIEPKSAVTRVRLRVMGDSNIGKLVVYSTIESEGKLILAYGVCPYKISDTWEQRLMLIVGSLRKP